MTIPNNITAGVAIDAATGLASGASAQEITVDLADLFLQFPGGVRLDVHGVIPAGVPIRLLGQLNTALMPLTPVFDIIDTVLSVVNVLEALASFNLAKAAIELVKFIKKAMKLLTYIPQASVPILILKCIDLLIGFLMVLKAELKAAVAVKLQVDTSASFTLTLTGPAQVAMSGALNTANLNLTAQINQTKSNAAPLNRLIRLINLIAQLVPGLPTIPSIDELNSDAAAAINELDVIIEALQLVRSAIPL